MAITDKICLKNRRQIVSQLDMNTLKRVFSGVTLEILYSGEGPTKVDDVIRDRLFDFVQNFPDCENLDNIYTGYPERRLIEYLLELRAQGLGPDVIVDVMSDDYMVYVYPGDVLSFLDDSARTLESVEVLADVERDREMRDEARRAKQDLADPR